MEIIPPEYMTADSLELLAGTSSSSVADLQTQYDGNIYYIDEGNATTPGFDLIITFINIVRFSRIKWSAYYKGSSSHYVEMQLWNYENGEWEVYTTVPSSLGMNTRFFDTADFDKHIRDGKVLMRFDHVPTGNNSHDFYIDYVALVR